MIVGQGISWSLGSQASVTAHTHPVALRNTAASKGTKIVRLMLASGIAFAHWHACASETDGSVDQELQTQPKQRLELADWRTRINAGEAREAISVIASDIEALKKESGPYDETLIDLYTVLGDAHYRLDHYRDALSAYRVASDISRIANGLHSPEHIGLAYREANMLARIGAWQSANDRHEYAYSIVLREYEEESDPRRIQGQIRLVDWYESTRKFRAALVVYDKLRSHVKQHYPPAHSFALAVRRSYVQALRETSFPMPDTKLAPWFRPRVPGWEPKPFRRRLSNYELGKEELESIGHIVLTNPVATNEEQASALLDLADWHVLFNRPHKGIQLYRDAWDLLEPTPDLLEEAFAQPKLIHMNVTRSWVSPERMDKEQIRVGVVQLSLHVNNRGTVVGRKTVATSPDNRMEYRVRVIAERAKYRPAFKDGESVRARNVPLVYNYALSRSLSPRR